MADQPIKHLEPIVDAAKATLVQNLAAAVAAVNAAHTDFQIEDVPADQIYIGGFTVARYPMVEVAVPDWTMSRISVAQYGSSLDMPLVVKVSAVAYDSDRLYRTLLRYVSAIIDVLIEPGAFPGVDVDRDRGIRGTYRFNPEADTVEDLNGSAIIVFYLQADETRT